MGKLHRLYLTKTGKQNIVHFRECFYLNRNICSAKRLRIEPIDILTNEYRFCQRCSPVSVKYREERKVIEDYASLNKQKLDLKHGMLYISNGYSAWIVVPGSRAPFLSLYHRNTINKINDSSPIEGYHLQKDDMRNIRSILKYIVRHDKYRKEINAQLAAEEKHIKEMARDASEAFLKNGEKGKSQRKHYTHKKRNVISADTSDWESFKALFKPNAAE